MFPEFRLWSANPTLTAFLASERERDRAGEIPTAKTATNELGSRSVAEEDEREGGREGGD